jgi:hypothetical protein
MKGIIKYLLMCLLLVGGLMQVYSCGDSDKDKDPSVYDPSKPTKLLTFYPDSGKFQEQVLLTGENMPTDVSQVKVYFNQRQAAVIGSTGTRMYVQAPRLPGDTCTISVVISGKDSLSYTASFYYKTSIMVTTIAGNGVEDPLVQGDLTVAQLPARYLCVDKDDNIFISTRGTSCDCNTNLCRIDEKNNELVLIQSVVSNIPAADPATGVISVATETTVGSFITMDPREFWAPRFREFKWPDNVARPANGWKHCMVVNPDDSYIYTRFYYGQVMKINPINYEAEFVGMTPQGDSYGLTFDPTQPGILYISMWNNGGGGTAHGICTMDVNAEDPASTFTLVSAPIASGGHRDGKLENAQFRQPAQIFCDADGNMYVADFGNHCIRRITPEKMVETVLGMPGTSGWKDGGKEDALFKNPRGIGIAQDGTVYIADNGNSRVRKLSIN